MLHLINTDRNHIRLIQQNISSHQYWICKETCVDIVCMFCRLIFKLRHTVQLSHIGKAVQDPCQLCVTGYMGLVIQTVLLRVNTCRNIDHQQCPSTFPKSCRILSDRDGMHIHHTVEALILVTESHPVFQCSKIIAKSQISCCLHAAEQHFLSI